MVATVGGACCCCAGGDLCIAECPVEVPVSCRVSEGPCPRVYSSVQGVSWRLRLLSGVFSAAEVEKAVMSVSLCVNPTTSGQDARAEGDPRPR